MSCKREYVEPEPVHDFIFDMKGLTAYELADVLGALLDELGYDVYRSNRNKHSTLQMQLQKRESL